jgi:tetratricopeptide (TPR) repeat protein
LHRRLVSIGLRRYGSGDDVVDLLARHAYLGGMGADALPYIERAADRATAVFANVEALGYLEQAIDIVQATDALHDRLPDLWMKRGELLGRTGRFAEAAEDYRRAYDRTGDPAALIAQISMVYLLDRLAECRELLDVVDRTHSGLSAAQRAAVCILRARTMAMGGLMNEAIRVLSDGLAQLAAEGGAGSIAEADLRQVRGRCRAATNANDDAMADLEIARTILEAADDQPRLATVLRIIGGLLTDTGQFGPGFDTLRRALEIARHVGHAEEIGAVSLNLGWAYSESGRLEDALASTREAKAAFGSMGLMSGVANAKVNECDILLDLGRLDEAKAIAAEALATAREIGHQRWLAGACAVLSEAALRGGEYTVAETYGLEALRLFESASDEEHAELSRARLDKIRAGRNGETV